MAENPFAILAKVANTAEPTRKSKPPRPTYKCPVHGVWKPPHPPKQDCNGCWACFGRWTHVRAEAAKLRPKGRAKGGGQSSKAKGRAGIQVVREALLAAAPWLSDGDIFLKATSQLGVDLHLSPAARRWFKYGIEVKNVESLNIWQALKQAESQAGTDPAIVFFRRAHSPLYVALSAQDFLALLPCPNV